MIDSLILALIISFIIQAGFFIFAYIFRTDKVTDLSYGFTFILLSLIFLAKSSFEISHILITLLVTIWGIRIAGYLFLRINKSGKDERFDKIRHSFIKFGGFWFFQAITVWIIMLPVINALNTKNTSLNIFSLIGFLIWLTGFIIESVADQQKYSFKSEKNNSEKWIQSGLWKYSRHPNYFGEILVWFGVFIFTVPYLSNFLWLSAVSPIFITFVLVYLSGIPPLERRYDEKYKENKDYQDYKRRTSILVPLPNKY